jgi:cytochrome c-type biogenesis protein CcmH/NrfG
VAIQSRKGLLALGAALLFILGAGAGVLLVKKFYSPTASLPDLPISQLLANTHQLLDKGQLDEAERNYRLILDRDPGNPEVITHLGNIASQRGDLDTALRYYGDALQRNPSYLHALWDKALALRAKGNDAGAIQTWEAFIRLVPPESQDAATVNKLIAESRARLAGQVMPPPGIKQFP